MAKALRIHGLGLDSVSAMFAVACLLKNPMKLLLGEEENEEIN